MERESSSKGGGRLEGKVAIVTGAGTRGSGVGTGQVTGILFAREGGKVLLVDRIVQNAEKTLNTALSLILLFWKYKPSSLVSHAMTDMSLILLSSRRKYVRPM